MCHANFCCKGSVAPLLKGKSMSKLNAILVFITLTVFSLNAHAQRRGAPAGSAETSFHSAGARLLETDGYELYEYRPSVGMWCDPRYGASVSLVLKVDQNYVITHDDAYKRRFEKEILPAIRRRCNSTSRVTVYHYIKGVRIDVRDRRLYGYNDRNSGWVDSPLANTLVTIDQQGGLQYRKMGRWNSLADVRNEWEGREKMIAQEKEREATEQELERKIANTDYSSDGKLKITGIKTEHKKLFLKIYNSEFAELLRLDADEHLPYLMFSGLIQGYNDLCRESLSPSAVNVDIYSERYVGSEYSPLTQTKYYEIYLAKTVYVEPKYEAAYRSSVPTLATKIWEQYRRVRPDANILQYFTYKTSSGLELAMDSRKLISNNGCKNPSVLKFIDNLHSFVTGNWNTKTADGYKYIEEDAGHAIKRFYTKVPPTFSPKFPTPDPSRKKEIQLILNDGKASPGLKWALDAPLGFGTYLIGEIEKLSPPKYVLDAKNEEKYHVVSCAYSLGGGVGATKHYWNANGPLPSAPVQEFLKSLIGVQRTECPTTYPGR